jgi:hypothetical protein
MKNEPLEVIRGSGKSCFAPFDPPLMSNYKGFPVLSSSTESG